MYTIIIAVDEDVDRALGAAEAMTGLPVDTESVRAVIVHNFSANPTSAPIQQVASVRWARDRIKEADIEIRLEATSGDPAEMILATADDTDADLICLASRKRSPTGKAVFGSVSQDIVLNSEYPVLLGTSREER